jgi:uncharacterized membrane protein YphA (DoxX/SURF4 family)
MKNAALLLKQFFLPYGSPNRLGLFRLCFGLYLLWHLLPLMPSVPLIFSVEGFNLPLLEQDQPGLDAIDSFFAIISSPVSVTKAYVFFFTIIASLIFFTLGIWSRIASLIFSFFFIYYYFIFFHFTQCAFDKINLIIMSILVFSPCDDAWSLKAWLNKRRGIKPPQSVPLWTQQLICLEISIMYFGTAVFKIFSGAWNGGEVIYTALMGDWTTPISFWLAQQNLQMGWYDILMISVIFFEITAWFMLYNQRWQKLWMWGGLLFHLSNALLLNVWEFMSFPITYILFLKSVNSTNSFKEGASLHPDFQEGYPAQPK